MNEKKRVASRSSLLQLAGQMAQKMSADSLSNITQEWIDNPAILELYLQDLKRSPFNQIRLGSYELTIDPKRDIQAWFKAAKLDPRDVRFDRIKFYNRDCLTVKKQTEPYKAKVAVFCLNRPATVEMAKRVRKCLKLQPIGFEHLAAIIEQLPQTRRYSWDLTVIGLDIELGKERINWWNEEGDNYKDIFPAVSVSRKNGTSFLTCESVPERKEWRDDMSFLGLVE